MISTMAAANNHKCQPVAEDGENKPAAAEQAPQDTPPECGKADSDPTSAGGSDLASQQIVSSKLLTAPDEKGNSLSASSDHGPEVLSAQNLRAHAAVVSSPSEVDGGNTVTSASLSESQPASSLSSSRSCFAVPLSSTNLISADPAELPDRCQNQGLQDNSLGISQVSASPASAGKATASAHSVKRDHSFVPRETPGRGPRRNLDFTASFKGTTAEKHSPSPANAAASNYQFAPAPGSRLQCRQPAEHLGGAALFGIGMRDRHDAAHMQTVNADIHSGSSITISTLERELGISVRGEDGAISLRRAREGGCNFAPFRMCVTFVSNYKRLIVVVPNVFHSTVFYLDMT